MKKTITIILFLILLSSFSLSIAEEPIEGSDIEIVIHQTEVNTGDTITATYTKKNDSITLVQATWVSKRDDGAGGRHFDLEDAPSGTLSFTAEDDGFCWLEIVYRDEAGTLYMARSNKVVVKGYTMTIRAEGVNDDNEIEVGDTLTLYYEVLGGNPDFTLEFNWCLDLGGEFAFHTEAITLTERTGSVSCTITDQMKHVGYRFAVFHNGKQCTYEMELNEYAVLNHSENTHSDIEIVIDQTEVNTGDAITATYTKKNDSITLIEATWVSKRDDGAGGRHFDLEDAPSGTLSFTAEDDGFCWLEIVYRDEAGTLYMARSNKVVVKGYTMTIRAEGVNDDNEIEVGDTLTLHYEVLGGNPGFTLEFNWCLDLGGEFAFHTEAITLTERTGSVSCTITDQMKHVGYRFAVFHNGKQCTYEMELDEYSVKAGHSWNAVQYQWLLNENKLTAMRVCKHNAQHIETETVGIECRISSPTKSKAGSAVYESANFANPAFSPQTYTRTIPALRNLDVLYIPSMTEQIQDEAFSGAACQAVIIPNGCISIGSAAFAGNDELLYVRIPASVTLISPDAFSHCNQVIIDRISD